MYVHCRTNLDLTNEEWPTDMPAVPNVGDHIQSTTKWGVFQLTLEVVRVTWKYTDSRVHNSFWYPEIEMHMTSFQRGLPCSKGMESKGSVLAFYEWYAPLVGRHVRDFI